MNKINLRVKKRKTGIENPIFGKKQKNNKTKNKKKTQQNHTLNECQREHFG